MVLVQDAQGFKVVDMFGIQITRVPEGANPHQFIRELRETSR